MSDRYPLKGIKVVELATAVAAPVAARIMASFGAEVIKVETPPYGDFLREVVAGQMKRRREDENPLFDIFNTGKKTIALNLKKEQGMEIFLELLENADVFVTNVRMKSLKGLGLDYDTLKERFPGLVYAHISGYGLEGPNVDAPGFDITAFWMMTGGSTDCVEPDARPLFPSFAFGDITSASNLLSGILMALLAKKSGGSGTFISTSLFNTGMWSNASSIIKAQGPTAEVFPASHYDTWDPFSFLYRCSDGRWIGIMEKRYTDDRPRFAKLFGLPELMEDPDFESLDRMNRAGKGRDIVRKMEEIIGSKTSAEWKEIFDENDVANSVAQHFSEIPEDPQARANNYLEDMEYYGGFEYSIPTPPVQFSEYDRIPFAKVPSAGSDTDEILRALGCSEEQLSALRSEKVII